MRVSLTLLMPRGDALVGSPNAVVASFVISRSCVSERVAKHAFVEMIIQIKTIRCTS